jgi:peptide deformylase
MEERIYLVKNKKEEEFLRKKTFPCAFDSKVFTSAGKELTTKDLGALVMRMKTLMHDANGIGLSANQVGLPYRFFVAKIPIF